MGVPNSVTLSSVGTSNGLVVDYMSGKPWSALVVVNSSTMTTDTTVQVTYDDLQSGSSIQWFNYPSSGATHYTSAWFGTPASITSQFPVAGLRLSSTAISSSSVTLKVLQGVGW